ncbi:MULTISPECIES: EAL domain-containing protein [Paenibacillus]|uniref:EAL domain-containing protein n=1 Tax=Paenibacillus TaxID=44249 RepID=UPI0022B8A540|nr:EAL domain-containing protein [Paenibacillus caseinilyticus]MCZ8520754.1 EAL domain-containing protein [Paenibacillus caseinilyticus]
MHPTELGIEGSYERVLVVLSYVIAVIASYTALDLGGRVASSGGRARRAWLLMAAFAMGIGIWSMHFVAMLAFQLPIHTSYDLGGVLLSMLFAVLGSYAALSMIARTRLRMPRLLAGGLLMGLGVAAMHYTGMASMKMNASISYAPLPFAASLAVAAAASISALWLTFYFSRENGWKSFYRKVASGLVMGGAIAGMHYTGMAAARFTPVDSQEHAHGLVMGGTSLGYGVGLAALVLLSAALLIAFFDRRIAIATTKLLERDQQFKSLFENNLDGVVSLDLGGRITSVNPAITRITGFSKNESLELFLSELKSSKNHAELLQYFNEAVAYGESAQFESVVLHKDGYSVAVNITTVPIHIDGKVTGVYGIIQDISKKKENERLIEYMAYHDDLTGLPNRRYLLSQIRESGRSPDIMLLLLDIDRFKMMNDSIGSKLGDSLLRQLAGRLQGASWEGSTVARIGSDEFAVLLPWSGRKDPEEEVRQLVEALRLPFDLDAHKLYLSFSIGYALSGSAETEETLLEHAHTALSRSKKEGQGRALAYTADMDMQTKEKIELENGLREAIERGQFEVHYQPQLDMFGKLIGAEALLRWHHPERGNIPPGIFIPVAEESGLINPIGSWVLRAACRQNRQWQLEGRPPVPVSVNLSIKQFEQPNLVEMVQEALTESGLSPEFLELEITESMAMDAAATEGTLLRLKSLGVKVSMDDFGTGYSSLSYLNRFPIDKLKIDQSFVRDIYKEESGASIVATIVAMAHHLKLSVIAEGVETKEQLDFLREQNCDQVQGYYYSPPLRADAFSRFWEELVAVGLPPRNEEPSESDQRPDPDNTQHPNKA